MLIYLASRWANQLCLREVKEQLEKLGHEVTSRWLYEQKGADIREVAIADIQDIDKADVLLLWPDTAQQPAAKYGGMFVEMGYALAKGKGVWVVEHQTHHCVFFQLPQVRLFKSWGELFDEVTAAEPVEAS